MGGEGVVEEKREFLNALQSIDELGVKRKNQFFFNNKITSLASEN